MQEYYPAPEMEATFTKMDTSIQWLCQWSSLRDTYRITGVKHGRTGHFTLVGRYSDDPSVLQLVLNEIRQELRYHG